MQDQGNASHKSVIGPMNHLGAVHVNHKNKIKLDLKNIVLSMILKLSAIRYVYWLNHGEDAQDQYMKNYIDNKCEYKIYTK